MSFKTFLQEFLRSINKIYVVYAEKFPHEIKDELDLRYYSVKLR